ncbi:hypothetical protein [Dyella subtropica]|nr:hypothetical protein [Dyella subtropica]
MRLLRKQIALDKMPSHGSSDTHASVLPMDVAINGARTWQKQERR